jgi:hypothetical protein
LNFPAKSSADDKNKLTNLNKNVAGIIAAEAEESPNSKVKAFRPRERQNTAAAAAAFANDMGAG